MRDRHLWHLPPLAPRLLALRMDAELDFASASALERRVTAHLTDHPEVVHLCLLAQPINRIDVTGVETFAQLLALMQSRGGTLHLSGLKLPVEQVLRQAGLLTPSSGLAMYRTDSDALLALQQLPEPVARV
ncbi:STAS domain protein [compost metagenome]